MTEIGKLMDEAIEDSSTAGPKPLKLGILGSCRVHNPIKEIQGLDQVSYCSSAPIRFLHNPLEIIDDLKILRGELSYDEDLMPISCQARLLTEERSYGNTFAHTDIIICEISSVRIAAFRETQLQINLLRNFLIDAGVSPASIQKLYSTTESGETESLDDGLAKTIMSNGSFYELTSDQITSALDQIMDLVDKPVLFVGFFDELESGKKIAQRVMINQTLETFTANRDDAHFFNPTALIHKYGFEQVILDMGHYKEEFMPTLAEELLLKARHWHDRLVSTDTNAMSL